MMIFADVQPIIQIDIGTAIAICGALLGGISGGATAVGKMFFSYCKERDKKLEDLASDSRTNLETYAENLKDIVAKIDAKDAATNLQNQHQYSALLSLHENAMNVMHEVKIAIYKLSNRIDGLEKKMEDE